MEELWDDSESEESADLYEHHRIQVDKGQQPLRIDKFLSDRIPKISRHKIQQAAEASFIKVNGVPIKSNYKVKPFDEIVFYYAEPKREFELIPENLPIEIIYEDADIIVVNKAPGMVVHPGHGNYRGTLVNGLIYHFKEISKLGDVRPGLVHRIDKDTSGLLVIAKNEDSMMHLAKQFFDRSVHRIYYALVWGEPPQEKGTITGFIGRSLKDRKIMQVFEDEAQGKHAVTHYEIIEKFGYVTLVQCKLETGRTHQIRVHFQHLGYPLFNDPTYGGNKILKGSSFTKYKQFVENCFELIPRQSLHARFMRLTHPKTGQVMSFESPLPEDFTLVLEKWRKYMNT